LVARFVNGAANALDTIAASCVGGLLHILLRNGQDVAAGGANFTGSLGGCQMQALVCNSVRKAFFFEKKKQKTFYCWSVGAG
jgi:hypothetical protein